MTDRIVIDPEHHSLIIDACAEVQDITRAVRKLLADEGTQIDPECVAARALMTRIETLVSVTVFVFDMKGWQKSTDDLRAIVEGAYQHV